MAAQLEKLTGTLQENIITLLAHDDAYGKIIASQIVPQLFEGEYRVIAERCLDFWKRHGEAPKAHMVDLVDDIVGDKANRRGKTISRILGSMLDLLPQINTPYVMSEVSTFTRMQRLKDAILKSAEKLNAPDAHITIAEVEAMWSDLLRTRVTTFTPPTRLSDYKRLLDYLENQYAEFITGIKELDEAEVVPARGTVMLMLAAKKRGKSWFLINCGAQAIMLRKRVLHFTLEMSEEQTLQRYYQKLFGATKYERTVTTRVIERDTEGYLKGIEEEEVKVDFTFNNSDIDVELRVHIDNLGPKANYLRIVRFPPRSVTVDDLRAYIENLEIVEGFIPDEIILDYVGILKADPKNPRIAQGRNMEEFRALMIERNAAGITAGQLSKEGFLAKTAGSHNAAEDFSMSFTADITLVFSATDAEKALGLGRLWVTDARDAEDTWGVLITQNYRSGQFCIDSIRLNTEYFDLLEDLKTEKNLHDDETPESSEED